MRLAVISDIHGNLVALEAVLADIKRRGVDQVVNCGDLCNSPLWPRETFDFLLALGLPTVRGNHDRWMGELTREEMSPALAYTHDQLGLERRRALAALPVNRMLDGDILMCHGTPTDDYEYLLEENHEGTLQLARSDLVQKRLGGITASLVLCGHSHTQGMALAPSGSLIVNPGSVGCPIFADNPKAPLNNCRAPHARYAMVTKGPRGWAADFISLAYDWEKAAKRAEANGRHEWAKSYRTGNV